MAATPDLSRGPALLAISVTTELFALLTCLIRFVVRRRSASHMVLDDYAIAVAAIVSFVGTIFAIIDGSSMVDSSHALEFDWLSQPWFMMGATFAKIAICLFFIRLVGPVKQWRIVLSTQIFLMAVLNFAFSLTTNLQCRPLEKLWNPAVAGVCWDPNIQRNIGYFQGAFSVFWWLFLSLFPVMFVRDLEVQQRMRWPFYFLSSLSLIAAVFATMRTYEISRTVPGVYTFDTFFAAMLSILEQNIGIVAANLLPMGSLFWSRHSGSTRLKDLGDSTSRNNQWWRQPQRQDRVDGRNPFESGAVSIHSVNLHDGINDTDVINDSGASELRRPAPSRSSSTKRHPALIIEGSRNEDYEAARMARAASINDNIKRSQSVKSARSARSARSTRSARNDTTLRTILNRSAALVTRSGRESASGYRGSLDEQLATNDDIATLWPRGIIKTVEVEVIEEAIAEVPHQHRRLASSSSDVVAAHSRSAGSDSVRNESASNSNTSRHNRMGSDSDWAMLLRSGPTPPGSRGPSRLGFN